MSYRNLNGWYELDDDYSILRLSDSSQPGAQYFEACEVELFLRSGWQRETEREVSTKTNKQETWK